MLVNGTRAAGTLRAQDDRCSAAPFEVIEQAIHGLRIIRISTAIVRSRGNASIDRGGNCSGSTGLERGCLGA